jgi:hypothetical protein
LSVAHFKNIKFYKRRDLTLLAQHSHPNTKLGQADTEKDHNTYLLIKQTKLQKINL